MKSTTTDERNAVQRARPRRRRVPPIDEKPCISKESLSNINAHKSFIAEMRPARRKIKWNSAVSDWDRRGDHVSTRIKVGIDLEELQFLGGVPLKPQQAEGTSTSRRHDVISSSDQTISSTVDNLSFIEGDAVEELERKINHTYDTIKRIAQENDEIDEQVESLKEQNRALGRDIAAIPMGKNPTRKGIEQLCRLEKKLRKKVREMERQCKLLKRRKNEIEQAKRRTRSEDGLDESRSYATHTSKSIASFVDDEEDDDEDIEIFTTGRSGGNDSESDFESVSSSFEEEEIVEEEIVEEDIREEEEEEEVSLGSFVGEKEGLAECKSESGLGDSLKELPYEPSISLL